MNKVRGGMVSCGHPLTAKAATQILAEGGNAFDAMIAAGLMSYVAEPSMTSAGGGGFMNVLTAEGKNVLFDFFVQTPRQKRPERELDFYDITIDFGTTKQVFHVGLGAAAVPGNLAGLFHVHKRLGSLPMRIIAEPAIEAARKGAEITPYAHYLLTLVAPAITSKEAGKALFMRDGQLKGIGEKLFFPKFADALEHLAREGNVREFYEGEIARRIVEDCYDKGGYLTADDLKNYQVYERAPLTLSYGAYTVSTNPPPATGGSLIAFMLKLLEPLRLQNFGFGSGQHLHYLANAMRLTAQARSEILDARLHAPDVLAQFLAHSYLDAVRSHLPRTDDRMGSTTHISIADRQGNIAAMTTSHGQGCGYVIPDTDIMLSNMLGEADLNPLGFHRWENDRRITSMMSPTLVWRDRRAVAAMGSGGANRIRSAILQVLLNLMEFELSPDEIVKAPRLHWDRNVLDIEPGYDERAVAAIRLPDEQQRSVWKEQNMFFGGVHSIFFGDKEQIIGVADDRRAGVAMRID